MESPKRKLDVDPDYQINDYTAKRLKLKETKDKEDTICKVKDIINSNFNTDLKNRKTQLDLIQQRITQVRKTMHMLRYVVISSYYNNKNCVINTAEDIPYNTDEFLAFDQQNRIHPAIKKLLGKNTQPSLSSSSTRQNRVKSKPTDNTVIQESEEMTLKQPEVICEAATVEQITEPKVIQKTVEETEECDTVRNRKKTKHRIVVGNISKWMPSESPEDNSTHKWMIYIRGTKDAPRVSHFIQKVVFYLHPSYKPNDVIEIKKDPFHLSRRGWGEFPVRVQIFFHCLLNKPVDIIHNLKLDRTYTGRQTLGNETIVDLYLYNSPNENENDANINLNPPAENDVAVKSGIQVDDDGDDSDFSFEHNYCTSKQQSLIPIESTTTQVDSTDDENIDCVMLDHCYCMNSAEQYQRKTFYTQNMPDISINGLSQDVTEQSDTIEEIVYDFKTDIISDDSCIASNTQENGLKQSTNEVIHLLTQDGRILILSAPNASGKPQLLVQSGSKVVSAVQQQSLLENKYKVKFPSDKFKNVLEALPFLFKRLPLITKFADQNEYISLYPYAASTLEEYCSWNLAKRLSCEWRRAKTIKSYLQSSIHDSTSWSTKDIIMYGRSHAYTPYTTYTLFKNNPHALRRLTKYESLPECIKPLRSLEPNVSVNVVDSDNDASDTETEKTEQKLRLVNSNLNLECSYVRKVALSHRTKLMPEEIMPGIIFHGAERMIVEGVKCFLNNLIRNARTHLVFQENFREETSQIGAEEINKALQDRPEFQGLLDFINKKSEMQYYW